MFDEARLKNAKHIHFIGIGGSGMFPLVQILHDWGYRITGSDNNDGSIVRAEQEMGKTHSTGTPADPTPDEGGETPEPGGDGGTPGEV